MTDVHRQLRRGWAALRDLGLISLAVVGLLVVGAATNAYDGIFRWLENRLHDRVGGALVAFALICGGLSVFAIRLWRSGQREAAARAEAETRYRNLVEQMPVVTYIDDELHDPPKRYIAPGIHPLVGYTQDEWLADPDIWRARLHTDDRARVLEAVDGSRKSGEALSIEYRILAKDGSAVWVRDDARIVERGPTPARSVWQGMVLDVTARKLAEQQLQEAEQRYRSLVETMPAVTYIDTTDEDWSAVYTSPQIESLFGYTQQEWQDPSTWEAAIHPDDHDRVVAAVERHNREGVPYEMEYRLRAKDGHWAWVSDHATVVAHEDRGVRYSQGMMFDVTERRQAEELLREAETRYRAIVEHVPAAIYVDRPDTSMETLYVSPQIEQIMGVSVQRYIDEPDVWLDLMAPESRAEMRTSFLEAIEARRSWKGEYKIVRPDGAEVWVHDETSFVMDEHGEPLFLQGVMFDITDRKLAEQALRSSEQREREAAERLRALDDMKNTFLAAVSHELRSPLTSILGLALTMEHQDLPDDDRRDLTGRLAQNARKLDRLLKDLLDIDRLSRGVVTLQDRPTDLAGLVRRTVDSLELGGRSVSVEATTMILPVEPPKVERIVENLVMNAIRHTARDVPIRVRLWRQDGGAVLAIEDEGEGVPEHLRSAIFEPFRQGPTATPHSPGTGIGLSLVGMFAELHGGRAWVEEREGGGASFRVYLPGNHGGRRDDGAESRREAAAPDMDPVQAR